MKLYILFLTAVLFSISVLGQSNKMQQFYVGAFTSEGAEGVYLCTLNSETGSIQLNQTFKGIDNPSFLSLSANKKYLYVASRVTSEIEKSGGYICAYKVGANGKLEFLNKQISNGKDPCYVAASFDGKYVASASYGSGTTSLYPVANDGSLLLATTVIRNAAPVANGARQNKPHAHSIRFSPFDNQVFSADLGTDQLNIYDVDKGELKNTEQRFVKMLEGAGPRHFDFHPDGDAIYVINELNSTITALRKAHGKWEKFQNISTLPTDFVGKSYCADIHISAHGRYLYGSNRGHNSIAVFEVHEKDRTLEKLGTVSTQGNWPRNFGITPDGKWMLVANQKSGDICVFMLNSKTGIPEFSGNRIKLPSPVCIEFL